MKRAISILILVLYFIPTVGVSVNLHFCGGKLSKISLWSAKSVCKCTKKTMKKGCCKQQQANYKITDKQCLMEDAEKVTFAKKSIDFVQFIPLVNTPTYFYTSFIGATNHPPPLLADQALYLFHQRLLI